MRQWFLEEKGNESGSWGIGRTSKTSTQFTIQLSEGNRCIIHGLWLRLYNARSSRRSLPSCACPVRHKIFFPSLLPANRGSPWNENRFLIPRHWFFARLTRFCSSNLSRNSDRLKYRQHISTSLT